MDTSTKTGIDENITAVTLVLEKGPSNASPTTTIADSQNSDKFQDKRILETATVHEVGANQCNENTSYPTTVRGTDSYILNHPVVNRMRKAMRKLTHQYTELRHRRGRTSEIIRDLRNKVDKQSRELEIRAKNNEIWKGRVGILQEQIDQLLQNKTKEDNPAPLIPKEEIAIQTNPCRLEKQQQIRKHRLEDLLKQLNIERELVKELKTVDGFRLSTISKQRNALRTSRHRSLNHQKIIEVLKEKNEELAYDKEVADQKLKERDEELESLKTNVRRLNSQIESSRESLRVIIEERNHWKNKCRVVQQEAERKIKKMQERESAIRSEVEQQTSHTTDDIKRRCMQLEEMVGVLEDTVQRKHEKTEQFNKSMELFLTNLGAKLRLKSRKIYEETPAVANLPTMVFSSPDGSIEESISGINKKMSEWRVDIRSLLRGDCFVQRFAHLLLEIWDETHATSTSVGKDLKEMIIDDTDSEAFTAASGGDSTSRDRKVIHHQNNAAVQY